MVSYDSSVSLADRSIRERLVFKYPEEKFELNNTTIFVSVLATIQGNHRYLHFFTNSVRNSLVLSLNVTWPETESERT